MSVLVQSCIHLLLPEQTFCDVMGIDEGSRTRLCMLHGMLYEYVFLKIPNPPACTADQY